MELKLMFVVLAVVVVVGVLSEESEPDGELQELLDHHHAEMNEARKADIESLKQFVAENVGERLARVEEMLQGVVNRQKLYHHCTPEFCGSHGECYVPEGSDEAACSCENYWHGKHCNESNPCHAELYNMQFQPVLLGRSVPRCDEEGYYAGMQYAGSMAICVTRDGKRLGYQVYRWEAAEDMPCECAREEFSAYLEMGEWDESFNCTEKGGYYVNEPYHQHDNY